MRIPPTLRSRLAAELHRLAVFATPVRYLLDIGAWVAAMFVAGYLRLDLSVDVVVDGGFLRLIPIVAALQLVTGIATGIYRRRWRYGSFDEMPALFLTAVLNTTAVYLLNEHYLEPRPLPQSAVLLGGAFGLVLMVGVRYVWRASTEYLRRPTGAGTERLLVFADGEVGADVVRGLLRDPASAFVPVGLIDDRRNRRRMSISGVPVVGDRTCLAQAAQRTGASALLVALPRRDPALMREITDLANAAHLRIKVLPSLAEVLHGEAPVGIRNLSEADLLGRGQIETNVEEIAGYVTGKRVLVTGAGGSIGSELCLQLSRFAPSELLMLDRDESALHAVQLSLAGRALLDSPDVILADLRDAAAIERIFIERCPEVVFHAAALKHLPLLEQYPAEAFKTNVVGTLNVLRAAATVGVEVFVNISTDKAANPTSVLGRSKRIAEQLTAAVGAGAEGRYLSVRFGNVLGSRGSVLVSFRRQIEEGGPVTVTHPDVTRYFMTVGEAVQLVIQAGAISHPGEVLVLDMGEPVRIYDLARRLVAQSGRDIDIVITGLRPGEKLHEELFSDDEVDQRPQHPLISHARVPAMDPSALPVDADHDELGRWMEKVCSGAVGGTRVERPAVRGPGESRP